MTDQPQNSHQMIVQALNETPLSQHLISLGLPLDPQNLVILDLVHWATENHWANKLLGEMEAGAAGRAAAADPEATYENLADDRMLEAKTLDEASAVLVSKMQELLGSP